MLEASIFPPYQKKKGRGIPTFFASCATVIPWDKPPLEESLQRKLYTAAEAKKAYSLLESDGKYALTQSQDLAGSDRYYNRSDLTPQILSLLPSAQSRIDESQDWERRREISNNVSGVAILCVVGGILSKAAIVATGGVISWVGSVAMGIYFDKQKEDTFDTVVRDYNIEVDRKLRELEKKQEL